jgi:hypothetical protein
MKIDFWASADPSVDVKFNSRVKGLLFCSRPARPDDQTKDCQNRQKKTTLPDKGRCQNDDRQAMSGQAVPAKSSLSGGQTQPECEQHDANTHAGGSPDGFLTFNPESNAGEN